MEAIGASTAPHVDRCIVCKAKKNGNFSRVELCRACSVFFRRTLRSPTPLLCRSSTGNCRIERERIYACAKCRFERIQKCLQEHEKATNAGPSKALDSTCMPTIPDSENFCRYLDEFRPLNVSPALRRTIRCYNDVCRKRLIIDFGNLRDLPFNEKGKIEAPATYATCGPNSMKLVREEIRSFLIASTDEFVVMRPEYQIRLLSNFIKQFLPFEGLYRSIKHFSARSTNRFYASFGRYLDLDNVADFYRDCLSDNMFKSKALKILLDATRKHANIVAPAMERLQLTDEEFIGIMAMLLWNLGHNTDSDELSKMAETKRTAALHDLYVYYKSIGIADYASRLGEIFTFLSLVETIVNESATLVKTLKALDVFGEEVIALLDEQFSD